MSAGRRDWERSLQSARAERRARNNERQKRRSQFTDPNSSGGRYPIGTGGCRKVGYVTYNDARRALAKIVNNSRREEKPQRIYQCPQCTGFHLTSKPARAKQAH